MLKQITICLLITACATPCAAQFASCDDGDPVIICLQKLIEGIYQEKVVAEAATNLLSRPSNATTEGSLVDLLAPFLGALNLGGEDSENGDVTLKKTFRLGANWRASIGGTLFADPEIYEPLKMKLEEEIGEDDQEEVIDSIGDQVERYQNLEMTFDLGFEGVWMGKKWGRRPRDYSLLAASAFSSTMAESNAALGKFVENLPATISGETVGAVRARRAGDAVLDQKLKEFDALIEEEKRVKTVLDPRVAAGAKVVADLVANQPQFIVTAKYKDLQEVVGPNSLEASLKWEFGLGGNVNGLEAWARSGVIPECTERTEVRQGDRDFEVLSLKCMERYAKDVAKSEEQGNRFSLTASYSDIKKFEFSIPDSNFEMSTAAAEKWIVKLAYGRWLTGFDIGGEPTADQKARFELEASYEDVSGDPMRQNRFIATATVTQRITNCTATSVGLVYANKPEFLGEVDKEISARVGIRWDTKELDGCLVKNK